MKTLLAVLMALMIPVAAMAADDSQGATDAATAWLKLVDAGNYAQSWSDASTLLKSRVDQNEWTMRLKPVRASLGAVVSRTPAGVQFMKSLPGAPDGDYAIVRFTTKFADKAEAKETVTLSHENGAWKCAGYFIN